MRDSLLKYYQTELQLLKSAGAEFAKSYPKLAGHLKMSDAGSEDPHVARLIESVAFMNARIHHKLNDDFPEITEALMDNIGPHYQRPFPSMAIVEFQGKSDLSKPFTLPRHTVVEAISSQGERYQFQTGFANTILPVTIESAELIPHLEAAPALPKGTQAGAVLKINLKCQDKDLHFAKLAPEVVRFYLKGQSQNAWALYDLLFKETRAIAISEPTQTHVQFLAADALKKVGFETNQEILFYAPQTLPAHRVLTEYLVYPDKFRFLDIQIPKQAIEHNRLSIFIYLAEAPITLQKTISKASFGLGCVPMVNLFKRYAEPIHLTHTTTEYPVILNNRHQRDYEVYAIDSVHALHGDGEITPVMPIHGISHDKMSTLFYQSRRTTALSDGDGSEMMIAPVDLNLNIANSDNTVLQVSVICCNRSIDSKLFFTESDLQLQLPSLVAPIQNIRCVQAPTSIVKPALGEGIRCKLMSMLSLNHTNLAQANNSPAVLKEVLQLHNFRQSADLEKMIESIQSLEFKPGLARVATEKAIQAYTQGTDINIQLDESGYVGNSLYLFASVLEQFLNLSATLNTFTRLTVLTQNGTAYCRFSPRIGNQALL